MNKKKQNKDGAHLNMRTYLQPETPTTASTVHQSNPENMWRTGLTQTRKNGY